MSKALSLGSYSCLHLEDSVVGLFWGLRIQQRLKLHFCLQDNKQVLDPRKNYHPKWPGELYLAPGGLAPALHLLSSGGVHLIHWEEGGNRHDSLFINRTTLRILNLHYWKKSQCLGEDPGCSLSCG